MLPTISLTDSDSSTGEANDGIDEGESTARTVMASYSSTLTFPFLYGEEQSALPVSVEFEEMEPHSSLLELPTASTISWIPESWYADEENPTVNKVDAEEENFKMLCCEMHIKKIQKDPKFYLGVPKESFKVVEMAAHQANMAMRDVLLILRKIRSNDTNQLLGHDFGISDIYVARDNFATVFQKWKPS